MPTEADTPLALPRHIAHRCGGVLAPENTLAGLHAAAARGFRAVEFDVMLSADGTPVLIHDETLGGTTDGYGYVSETSDAVLFSLDAGGGERLPSLAEAASLCAELGLLANVEIKPAADCAGRTGEVVARFVAEHWPSGPAPLLTSFSPAALSAARRVSEDLRIGILFDRVPADWRALMRRFDAITLHCDAEKVSDELLAEAVDARVPVLCYTVDDPEQAAFLFTRGVSAIFTDRLDLFDPRT